MATTRMVSLREHFAAVADPRRDHGKRHNLWDIVALAIWGVVCGADSWVEEYGLARQARLETFLELPGGIPAHDTLGRVFSPLDPRQLRGACTCRTKSRRPCRAC